MFGKKNPNDQDKVATEPVHDIGVIPDIFYGGSDPDIYNEKEISKKEVAAEKKETSPVIEKKEAPVVRTAGPRRLPPPPLPTMESQPAPVTASPAPAQMTKPVPAPPSKAKTVFIVLVVAILLSAGAFAVWYFFFRPSEAPTPVQNPSQQVTSPQEETLPPTLPPVETSTVSLPEEPTTPTSSLQRERSLPLLSFLTVADSDNDKLTAPEEEIFQTDPETFDSDSDGYYDGQEVFNLYNPKGIAPMKIIDSGLVQEYVNPTFQYKIYFPVAWRATAIDERDNKQVLFSAITGDYVEVKAYDKVAGESFPGWFGRVVGDQIYTDLVPGTNRFSVPFYGRKDGLVSYFDTPNTVYIVIFYSISEDKNDFPHVMDMMVQSFRPAKTNSDLPLQRVVPSPDNSASSSVSGVSESVVSVSSTER